MLCHVHKMFEDDSVEALNRPIIEEEVLSTLRSFSPDKCSGPDGWPSEFYLFFFDQMGPLITEVVEHTRMMGHMPINFNSTFIALIQKSGEPYTFMDFKPISLCNLIYKISSKIIANRIKVTLEQHISLEQYGFLK